MFIQIVHLMNRNTIFNVYSIFDIRYILKARLGSNNNALLFKLQ